MDIDNTLNRLLQFGMLGIFAFILLTVPMLLLIPVAIFAIGFLLEIIGIDVNGIPVVGMFYDVVWQLWATIAPNPSDDGFL